MRLKFHFVFAPLFLSILVVLVLVLAFECWSAPTLARLSFWAPPERMAEFETAYQEKVVPILKKHGLVESSERGRANVEGIFSRLFEMNTSAEVEDKGKALGRDTEWQEVLQNLGTAFGTNQPGGQIQYRFGHYSTPAGTSRIVSAGSVKKSPAGRGQGHWRTYHVADGIASGEILSIYQDQAGNLWFGTDGCGVSRYDGITFTTFTTEDGLADNQVRSIYQDSEGNLWFGFYGGVVSKYDGQVFQTLTPRDGLPGGPVRSILQDGEGSIWFTTYNGVVRHRQPKPSPPPVFIDAVVADRRYKDISEVTIPSSVRLVAFEFHGISFKTRPEAMVYRYRLVGYDENWHNTHARRLEYKELPKGSYTFEVIAVDRDLVYSGSPATVELKIVPPFYLRAGFLAPTISFGSILLAMLVILSTALMKRRRQVQAYQRAAVLELQDAQEMQMSLMPKTALPIEGLEIAGKCVPANTVSGDFFDYLEGKRKGEIALVVADVTGKAMKGAMNAVMVDGVLRTAADGMDQLSPSSLMMIVNNILPARMERDMNVTMVIAVIDTESKTLTLANAAHHAYPLILRNGNLQVLKTGGLPLGMRARIQYTGEQFQLQNGDVLILMTDGIIEAKDSEDNDYSESGRLEKTILQFTPDMPPESMVDAIINDAIDYSADKTQRDDDMTVVVAKVL